MDPCEAGERTADIVTKLESVKLQETEQSLEEETIHEIIHKIPFNIIYCSVCGLPAEYCIFNKNNLCKEWLQENHPTFFPIVYGLNCQQSDESKETSEVVSQQKEQNGTNQASKKKVKFQEPEWITLTKNQKNRSRVTTIVKGLARHGIDVKKFSRDVSSKFCCGTSVGDNGELTVQGDFTDSLAEFLISSYSINQKSLKREQK